MAAAEPQTAIPAPAGDAPVQELVDTVQYENEKADDAQASAEPIPPPPPPPAGSDPSSSEKPGSSDNTTSQPAVTTSAAAAADSQKGKEKADAAAAATEKKPTSDNPPALPQKETDDSLSIEPSVPAAQAHTTGDHPVCNITLLLPTGARHPYRIDERYLAKRGVDVPDAIAGTEEEDQSGGGGGGGAKKDPFSISVYTLKELILREWREEWNDKPASPSSIRLIHFGKLLDDKEQLKKYQFSRDAPNVVHMSVRPAEMMEEDEAAKGKSGGREGRSREGGSNCCVIL